MPDFAGGAHQGSVPVPGTAMTDHPLC